MSALQNLPTNINYLSPVGFRFTLANFPDVNYFCQAANIPGLSIGGIDIGTPLRNIQIAGDEVSFEELTIQFVVDENMKNWISIYDWIISIGTPTQESIRKYVKLDAQDEKTQDATLTVLTSNMNPQMHFRFQDCVPLNLSSIEFDSKASDVDYVTATVSFRYDVYTIDNLLNNERSYGGAPVADGR